MKIRKGKLYALKHNVENPRAKCLGKEINVYGKIFLPVLFDGLEHPVFVELNTLTDEY